MERTTGKAAMGAAANVAVWAAMDTL